MKKKIFDDEVELKKFLSKDGFIYGELGCNTEFVIIYRDNKSFAPIIRAVVTSPIEAIRKIGDFLPQIKLPIEDIDIQLVIAYDLTAVKSKLYSEYICLSPYLYYTKKEINGDTVIQSKEQNTDNSEKVENK